MDKMSRQRERLLEKFQWKKCYGAKMTGGKIDILN